MSGQQIAQILKSQGHHVNDLALPFDISIGLKQISPAGDPRISIEDIRSNNQVRHARLIFEGDENDAAGRPRTLTDQHDPRNLHPAIFALF